MLHHTKKIALFSLSIFSALAINAYAATPTQPHVVVAPNCLINKLSTTMQSLASNNELSLIETNEQGVEALITAKAQRTNTPCGGFVDVTDAWQASKSKSLTASEHAASFLKHYASKTSKSLLDDNTQYSIRYESVVNQLIKNVNADTIWADLSEFSNTNKDHFPNRYANSDYGVKAAEWLKSKIEAMAKDNQRTDISTYFVATGSNYKQPSLVVKIGNSNEPGVVIGGHMDTLNSTWELKPGADDDGSGSMTVMEIARTLINSGTQFKKPIYIVWYSAEELGLIGSGYVVKDFKQKNIPVDAVLQFDMTGYAYKNDPTIWLITDNVNKNLTDYIETLVKTYVKQPVGRTRCGYSCSDHASWTNGGFKSAFPFESSFGNDDPYIHTSQDTIDVLSKTHMADFAKLGVAFAAELAEPLS